MRPGDLRLRRRRRDYEKRHAGQVVGAARAADRAWSIPSVEVRPATHQVDDVLQEIRDRGREERARADHHADQAHGRAAHRLPGRQRRQGALPAQRHRHGGARRDPARPAPGQPSTCWSASTCCAKGWTFPRCRWWRSSMPTRRGFLRAERSPDPDHRPGGAQPERQGDPLRRHG